MAWCWPGDKPLFQPMMVSLLRHICITWPRWVNALCVYWVLGPTLQMLLSWYLVLGIYMPCLVFTMVSLKSVGLASWGSARDDAMSVWVNEPCQVLCVVMLLDSSVTLHCQNISSCHTDHNEPIISFILLLTVTWCGLLGWFMWLTLFWGMGPSHNDVFLGGKAHLVVYCYQC